jgi:hypothetical protein
MQIKEHGTEAKVMSYLFFPCLGKGGFVEAFWSMDWPEHPCIPYYNKTILPSALTAPSPLSNFHQLMYTQDHKANKK